MHTGHRREPPAKVPSTAKHTRPICRPHVCVCLYVCVSVCIYIYMANAYLKNKELFIGMIFPFLSPGLFLLKFHFFGCSKALFRE